MRIDVINTPEFVLKLSREQLMLLSHLAYFGGHSVGTGLKSHHIEFAAKLYEAIGDALKSEAECFNRASGSS